MTEAELAQRMKALAHADVIRLGRSKVKRELAAGTLTVREALGRECCRSMRVWDLLGAQYRWGPLRVAKLMRRMEYERGVMVSQERRVGGLSVREREVLEGMVG